MPVRARAYVLVLLLIPANCYWVLAMQVAWNLGYPSMLSLFFNVIFILFLLMLANRMLLRVAPRQALAQPEMLVLYMALAISTAVTQFAEYLIPVLAGPCRLASPEAGWLAGLGAPFAHRLTVRDADAARDLVVGNSSVWAHLSPWLGPFLGWTLFVLVLLFTTLCLGTLFYRQWTESERLSFPIVQIPVQMTAAGGFEALRAPLFWIGFSIAGGLICWNGVATLLPWVPPLPIKRQAFADFTAASVPFNALGTLHYSLHPFVIGLGYFLPLDLTFSLGACYWLQQLARLGAAAVGFGADNPRFPYIDCQAFGAWAMIFAFSVWLARAHLRRALRQCWAPSGHTHRGGGSPCQEVATLPARSTKHGARSGTSAQRRAVPPHPQLRAATPHPRFAWVPGAASLRLGGRWRYPALRAEQSERLPLSYRAAFLGALGGFALLSAFAHRLGLSLWAAAVFFALYFSVVTAMAKARAELGPPAVDLFFTVPGKVMVTVLGGRLLGSQTLISMSLFYWLMLEYPWHPMGHQLEALRIGDQQCLSPRRMMGLLLAAALLAWTAAFWIVLHLDYTLGAGTARQPGQTQMYYARDAYMTSRTWSTELAPPDRGGILAIVAGAGIAALLSIARLRIIGWPLHPVGYALVGAFTTNYLWLPLWMSCLIKGMIVRYGGLYTYRRWMPLFLGLVLGEFVIGSVWAVASVMTGQRLYVFWPY